MNLIFSPVLNTKKSFLSPVANASSNDCIHIVHDDLQGFFSSLFLSFLPLITIFSFSRFSREELIYVFANLDYSKASF
jgi:hypothetical protein